MTSDAKSLAGPLVPKLLVLLAISMGILVTEPPLATDRVLRSGATAQLADERNGYPSYFWEDPFQVARIFKPEPTAEPTRPPKQLKELIEDDVRMVIFAGLDGESDPASVERRIRTRSAVASALSGRADMLCIRQSGQLKPCRLSQASGRILAACEIFEGINLADARWFKVGQGKVVVVYVNEIQLPPTSGSLRFLAEAAGFEKHNDRKFTYIGVGRSDYLWRFIGEAAKAHSKPVYLPALPVPEITVYSPFGSAEHDLVWEHLERSMKLNPEQISEVAANDASPPPSFSRTFDYSNSQARIRLHRLGADDGDLCRALIEELYLRGIPRENQGDKIRDGVLILADADRYHSRLLVGSFRKAWQHRWGGKDAMRWKNREREAAAKGRRPGTAPPRELDYSLSRELTTEVRVVHYLEALDGMSAGPEAGKKEDVAKPSSRPDAAGGVHPAEGFSQYDSLRRLPPRLRDLERADGVRYRAIGLFGSDVHDKLLLLRALRPAFPEAVYFTNDLDARLWQGKERSSSTNLVVAGAFGLALDGNLQGDVPPFRSSYQTATYLACLHAIGFGHRASCPCKLLGKEMEARCKTAFSWPGREVEIHEIGRTGDHLLSYGAVEGRKMTFSHAAKGRLPSPDSSREASRLPRRMFRLLIVAAACMLLVQLAVTRPSPLRRSLAEQRRKWTLITGVAVVLALGSAYFLPELVQSEGSRGEPCVMFGGIGSMTVVAGNLLVLATGLVMLAKSIEGIEHGTAEAAQVYPFAKIATTGPGEHPPSTRFRRWNWGCHLPSSWDLLGWAKVVIRCLRTGWRWTLRSRSGKTTKDSTGPATSTLIPLCLRLRKIAVRVQRPRLKAKLGRIPENRLAVTYAREMLAGGMPNRMFRVFLWMLAALWFQKLLSGAGDFSAPPSVRGPHFRVIYEWSDMLSKAMIAVMAIFAMDAQALIARGLRRLNRFTEEQAAATGEHTIAPANERGRAPYDWTLRPDIPKSFWQHHPAGMPEIGLWEMPMLRVAADRYRAILPLAVLPFVLLFIMLVSRHAVFENVTFAFGEIVFFSLVLLGPLVAGAIAQSTMHKSFELVGRNLRRGARQVPDKPDEADPRKDFFGSQKEVLADLEARTRFRFLGNPLVDAVLLPLGGVGILEISTFVAPYLK